MSIRPKRSIVRSASCFREVTDVARDDEGIPSALAHPAGGDLEVVDPPGVEHHVASCVGQAPRNRSADPLAGPGDDGDAAGQLELVYEAHAVSSAVDSRGRNCPVLAVMPPSTGTTAPLTNDESAEARNAITAAISSGRAHRCSGIRRRRLS